MTQLVRSPLKMKLYFLMKLPLAFLAGLKVVNATPESASVSVPFKYLNKNPFRSMYFAVLAMAAELPTGILILLGTQKSGHNISTLVLQMKASFLKKAVGKIVFTCEDGVSIQKAIDKCILNDEPETVDVKSVGLDGQGDVVAEFLFTWTLKKK